MNARSVTFTMSSSTTPPVTVTEKTKLQLPPAAWFLLISSAAAAGGAWFSLRGDVTRQGVAIETNRIEAQRQITELRVETKEQIMRLGEEQKVQRDLLIRIDENVKRIPR